ncbi:hypothetical protein [Jannaschia sp. M317]|uniref:hypothetical protein n=1 Tax=Jannaschia sp. M317 TaxID=2867011 RepID=UPI0021A3202E|nr:hypothetical protein [Jannaschia sp. M317]UWQ17514.1 hypothetical protein K3551_16825 [Jannaschia sp. M317]
MQFTSLQDLTARAEALGPGPVLMVLCEDGIEVAGTVAHHLGPAGFRCVVLALAPGVPCPDLPDGAHSLTLDRRPEDMATACVNALIDGRPAGSWIAWCYNAEYLFTPFMETRTVGEALAFCTEERRDAVRTIIVDLYGAEMAAPLDPGAAWLDPVGYYALDRWDKLAGAPLERQQDVFGGLRWRFEEHVPWERRSIARVSMFRTARDLRLLADHTTNDAERNTYSAPWHPSPSACVASFRAAKALSGNPGSRRAIAALKWAGSVPFEWRAQQLMDLGLMEPGQWF